MHATQICHKNFMRCVGRINGSSSFRTLGNVVPVRRTRPVVPADDLLRGLSSVMLEEER